MSKLTILFLPVKMNTLSLSPAAVMPAFEPAGDKGQAAFLWTVLVMSVLALTALAFDIRRGKIPNLLTFSGLTAGLLAAALGWGTVSLPACLAGICLPFLVLWPLFVLRMMGAGDIKLLMALGAVAGYPGIARLFLWSVISGSVIALVRMFLAKSFGSRLGRFGAYVREALSQGRLAPYPGRADREARLPFAVPVFAGTVIYIFLSCLSRRA